MTGLDPVGLTAVLLWGLVASLDLVSGPQLLLSRPLVAGTVSGLLLGDPLAGLAAGAVLELFALEVVPIGAIRYPDFSLAAVIGTVATADRPLPLVLGMGVGVGLVLAEGSRGLMDGVRRRNASAAQAEAAALARGDAGVVARLQVAGLGRDAWRATLLLVSGLAAAVLLRKLGTPAPGLGVALTSIAVAGGAAAALTGAVRTISQGGRWPWLALGGAGGLLLLVLR